MARQSSSARSTETRSGVLCFYVFLGPVCLASPQIAGVGVPLGFFPHPRFCRQVSAVDRGDGGGGRVPRGGRPARREAGFSGPAPHVSGYAGVAVRAREMGRPGEVGHGGGPLPAVVPPFSPSCPARGA